MSIERFFCSQEELVALMNRPFGTVTRVKFSPQGAWLEWNTDEPLPNDVRDLATMRGIDLSPYDKSCLEPTR